MIDLHYWPTPNGWKISIMLEECALPYRVQTVDIGRGEQFRPGFLAISPNNRIPAIVDHAPADGGAPLALFESGAILMYLAQKADRLWSAELRERHAQTQWLMWQMAGLGPMSGQNGHFRVYAAEQVPYAIERYGREVNRLYGVLDGQLQRTGAFVAGAAYSIADIAILPWTAVHAAQEIALESFPHIARWQAALLARPAVQRGLALGRELRKPITDAERTVLFGQSADSVRTASAQQPL